MNHQEKKAILKELKEKEFRSEVIIPILSKMGYKAPIEYHGAGERGKDIICFDYDKLGEQRFLAVVAKIGDLTGNAATDSGLITIVNQIHQAFDVPYEDLYNMKQVHVNEVWVMTTGKIVSGAQESVINTLRKTNLDKHIRFVQDDRLVELIDEHFRTFWNSNAETKESVIIQRDRLLNFIENLLQANNATKETIDSVKATILYSDFNPSIRTNVDGMYISNISSYSIELAEIDPEFDDYIVSTQYGLTKETFAETKKLLKWSFMYVDQAILDANKISKLTNPKEFLSVFEDKLEGEYPFHNAYGSASEFLDNISYLQEGLQELDRFKKFLLSVNKLDWAKLISKSIPKLQPEINKIIDNCKDEKVTIHYAILIDGDVQKVFIQYDNTAQDIIFSTSDKKIDKTSRLGRDKEGLITSNYIVSFALAQFRKYLEKSLNYNEDEWMD